MKTRTCSNCEKEITRRIKSFSKRVFCNQTCYSNFRRDKLPIEEHFRWQGGVSNTEAHKRWKAKNPERMSHLKARRYARERGAEGSHTLEQWESLKKRCGYKCVGCKKKKPLTKDHIVPLVEGGTDYITNIQPLCRNCNSRKWKKINIYENPELIKQIWTTKQ